MSTGMFTNEEVEGHRAEDTDDGWQLVDFWSEGTVCAKTLAACINRSSAYVQSLCKDGVVQAAKAPGNTGNTWRITVRSASRVVMDLMPHINEKHSIDMLMQVEAKNAKAAEKRKAKAAPRRSSTDKPKEYQCKLSDAFGPLIDEEAKRQGVPRSVYVNAVLGAHLGLVEELRANGIG